MILEYEWDEIYKYWRYGADYFPKAVTELVKPIFVPVIHDNKSSYIWGYDWLESEYVDERIEDCSKHPFYLFWNIGPSNKGTLKTVTMLAECHDEEIMAAIWIAATAFELKDRSCSRNYYEVVDAIYRCAAGFLYDKGYVWHHAMTRRVPEIMIPYTVLNKIDKPDAEAVMGLIQTNVALILGHYKVLMYSSLSEEELKEKRGRL